MPQAVTTNLSLRHSTLVSIVLQILGGSLLNSQDYRPTLIIKPELEYIE
jgi:hypothetical protein